VDKSIRLGQDGRDEERVAKEYLNHIHTSSPFCLIQRYLQRQRFYSYHREASFFCFCCQELVTAHHVSVTLNCQPVRLSSSNATHATITGNDGATLAARLDQKMSGLRMTIGEHEGDPSDEGNPAKSSTDINAAASPFCGRARV
jgi:hypothetical protein